MRAMAKRIVAPLAGIIVSAVCISAIQFGIPTTDLLQKARPYKRGSSRGLSSRRHLDVELDGSYNIQFSQCVDVKLRDDDLFQDEVVSYVQDGEIVSTKSYILFHLCQNNECFYESEDDLYMVDLASYLTNVAQYHATTRTNYCNACNSYVDYCSASDDGAASDDDAAAAAAQDDGVAADAEDDAAAADVDDAAAAEEEAGEEQAQGGDDGERRNMMAQRRIKSSVDCDQCAAYNCYNTTNDDAQQSQEDFDSNVADMIGDLVGCLASGQYWNEEQLYLSAICSPYGDGVELAVFLDDECTVYTNKATFQGVYQQYIYENNVEDLSGYAEKYIKSAFEEAMPCKELDFADPDEASDDDADYGNANDFCQQIFDEGALDFNQCYNENYQFGSNYNEDDQYSWYTYDMTYDEAKNIDDVCSVVYQMSGEYSYSYDVEKSGTWYDRDESGKITSKKSSRNQNLEFSSTAITLLVLLGVGIVGISACFSYRRSKARRMEPLYQGGAMI
ncbi:hypothetical protein HJC23_010474 [Cyclotella cryptica]|uniref:Uncharacterized protein n=1 Tax=Cyclotella cryptica TaxID=29204 RepID=A0ABD3QHI9_9STRA